MASRRVSQAATTEAMDLDEFRQRYVGRTHGRRTVIDVIDVIRRGDERKIVLLVECECGRRDKVRANRAKFGASCVQCGIEKRRERLTGVSHSHEGQRDPNASQARLRALREAFERAPEVWTSDDEIGLEAAEELAGFWGPMTLAEMASILGISRERARQLVNVALAKVRLKLGAAGRDYYEHIESRRGASDLELMTGYE